MRTQRIWPLILVAIAMAAPLAARDPNAPKPEAGHITGTVTDVNNDVLAGATVVLEGPGRQFGWTKIAIRGARGSGGLCEHEATNPCFSSLSDCPFLHYSFQCQSRQDSDVDVDHAGRDNRSLRWLGRVCQFSRGSLWLGRTREFDGNGCCRYPRVLANGIPKQPVLFAAPLVSSFRFAWSSPHSHLWRSYRHNSGTNCVPAATEIGDKYWERRARLLLCCGDNLRQ